MRSVYELRSLVAEYYFCGDQPWLITSFGKDFLRFWDKLNAISAREMTDDEWRAPSLGNIDKRPILTQEEFDLLFEEACALRIETSTETNIETGLESDFE